MRRFSVFMIFFVAVLGSSCQMNRGGATTSLATYSTCYAEGFKIKRFKNYTTVEVKNPWSKESSALLQRYILVDRNKQLPSGLPKGTLVRIPVKRMIVYTSVQCSVIEQLGCMDDIVGVCEPQYIDSEKIKNNVISGKIIDVGEATAPNIEKMINLESEVIMASPFENCGYGVAEKIGIPIIEFADYMEQIPLARTEWIKFYGLLLGKEEMADSIFSATCERYDSLKMIAAAAEERPTIIAERKYGSAWSVPGGESYMGTIYKDAGADYIFSSLAGKGSLPISYETVLAQGIHADFWVLKYNMTRDMTYEDLRNEYKPYENFDAFKNRKIFACNTGRTPYYDAITLHPDFLLENLIWVFHPDLMPDYKPSYFFPLQ